MCSSAYRTTFIGTALVILVACGELTPLRPKHTLEHTVSRGETLYSIAWKYGHDFRAVAAWNEIEPPYRIFPGQKLDLIPPHNFLPPATEYEEAPAVVPVLPEEKPAQEAPSASQPPPPLEPAVVVAPAVLPRTPPVKAPRIKLPRPAPPAGKIAWLWPTSGKVIKQFAPGKGNKGLDIRGTFGQKVVAVADGSIVYSGSGLRGYGKLVIVKHNDVYLSAYGHNSKLLVQEGDDVKQGETIARMGKTSKKRAVLHFEIRRYGKPVNPTRYLPKQK